MSSLVVIALGSAVGGEGKLSHGILHPLALQILLVLTNPGNLQSTGHR